MLARQDDYRKSGFKLAYRNIRFEGKAVATVRSVPGVISAAELPFALLEDYDRRFFPERREAFLKHWLRLPGVRALAMVESDRLTGCGVLRPCRNGFKIGPLFADGPHVASALFDALTSGLDAAVYLDVPEVNPAAVELAERNGMSVVFETARMYTRTAPPLALEGIFGVTTFELG